MTSEVHCRVTHSRRTGTSGDKVGLGLWEGVWSIARYGVFGCRGMSEKAEAKASQFHFTWILGMDLGLAGWEGDRLCRGNREDSLFKRIGTTI